MLQEHVRESRARRGFTSFATKVSLADRGAWKADWGWTDSGLRSPAPRGPAGGGGPRHGATAHACLPCGARAGRKSVSAPVLGGGHTLASVPLRAQKAVAVTEGALGRVWDLAVGDLEEEKEPCPAGPWRSAPGAGSRPGPGRGPGHLPAHLVAPLPRTMPGPPGVQKYCLNFLFRLFLVTV